MIRPTQQPDIPAITAIYNYYIENSVVSFEDTPLSEEEMGIRIEVVLNKEFPWLVAESDGKIIGYAYACYWNTRAAYCHSAEVTVYLHPDETGKGWGKRLYQTLFQLLEEKEVKRVIGGIALPNPASVALHEKAGMKKVAHFEKIGFKFDQWIDVAYWQGDLDRLELSTAMNDDLHEKS